MTEPVAAVRSSIGFDPTAGFAESEVAIIGEIILAWGAAERLVGSAILYLDGSLEAEVAKSRFEIRVHLLNRLAASTGNRDFISIAKAIRAWKAAHGKERNIIAHGMAISSVSGMMISNRDRHILARDLPNAAASARYIADLSMLAHLHAILPQLPPSYPRPPAAPAPPAMLVRIIVGYDDPVMNSA